MNFYKKCINFEVYAGKKYNAIKRYKIRTFNPAKNAVYLLRMYQYHSNADNLKTIHNFFAKTYYRKLFTTYNIFLRQSTKIGMGLSLPHPTSIVFGEYAQIGENCTIYQNVTFGGKKADDYKQKKQPKVGNGCIIYANACVLGDIHLGDNTIVGANSVLTENTEENSVYVGLSRKIK